jgi:pyruvate kinase
MTERKAKIVCTLGPACDSPEMIDRMIQAGMDVARLNFSHGTPQEHARRVALVRKAGIRHQKPIAILGDLQGPKIRTGPLDGGKPVQLHFGQKFTITSRHMKGTADGVSTTFQALPAAVKKGDPILLCDGRIALRVVTTNGKDVICQVENGGELGEHKGINLPGVMLKIPSMTHKDRKDLLVAIELEVSFVAMSFVRSAADVLRGKKAIAHAGGKIPIIAKLEKPQAIDNLEEILSVADGVMVARGDLGVEMSPEKVPVVQKQIILRARNALIPVITATQMLDSMQDNPRPTRAEASDVANAIFDGSDALMLSGETAAGHYPLESLEMMDRIIREAEASVTDPPRPARVTELHINETIAEAICHAAEELRLKAIAVFTESGSSARLVSKYRPRAPIIGFSANFETRRRMGLLWGVLPRTISDVADIDHLVRAAERRMLAEGLVQKGDIVGIVAGTPLRASGTTNLMKLHRIE